MTKTRAAVLKSSPVARPYAQTLPLSIEEIDMDDPGHGEIRVRIAAAGLAIPISPSSTATDRVPCRWRWVTRRRAWSRRWATASTISSKATTSS